MLSDESGVLNGQVIIAMLIEKKRRSMMQSATVTSVTINSKPNTQLAAVRAAHSSEPTIRRADDATGEYSDTDTGTYTKTSAASREAAERT